MGLWPRWAVLALLVEPAPIELGEEVGFLELEKARLMLTRRGARPDGRATP
jgi:hypothetical protein